MIVGLIDDLVAAASLGAWLYLLAARGSFWRIQAPSQPAQSGAVKSICVIIPARNEEQTVAEAVKSLRPFPVIVVDDHSSDRTAAIASEAGASVIQAGPLPAGWSGKLWAISEGLKHARSLSPDYLLLTDADIVHAPDNVAGLVSRAETENLDLVSWMVKLQCRSFAETLLIPAFVFFFFMLYPPNWVARQDRKTAAAAGGCILIRPEALDRIGGIEAIRGEIIDDCALARAVKRSGGRIWLGVTEETHSIRGYASFAEIRAMISRTAFAQLHHSALLLFLTILGMAVVYIAPPVLSFTRSPIASDCGFAAWLLMTICYAPALRFYNRSAFWAPLLPLIALFYISATVHSAIAYWTGRGGEWKGRIQDERH
ncbi:MAG TPA: glycosyltransferase [Bryobacteraceae bacterium]|nr:glycosyltransferase [Bryobacteraceae bacterium]